MSGAITATAVAVAAMSATEIFTAIAVVGAVTGAIGAVTGSKELQIAGTVMGVVGGVGGIASSAGLFAGAGDLFGVGTAASVAESASSSAGALSSVTQAVDENLGAAVQGINSVSDMSGPSLSAASGLPIGAVEPGTTQTPLLGIGDTPAPTVAAPSVTPDPTAGITPATEPVGSSVNNPPQAPATSVTGGTGSIINPEGNLSGFGPGQGPQGPAMSAARGVNGAPADPSAWSKIWDFTKTAGGGALVSGGIQAAASFLSGATSSLTPAQVNALNAQAMANQAAVNLSGSQQAILDQQLGNMRDPLPIAARPSAAAVTGAPQGLINQPPPKAAVTGVPA